MVGCSQNPSRLLILQHRIRSKLNSIAQHPPVPEMPNKPTSRNDDRRISSRSSWETSKRRPSWWPAWSQKSQGGSTLLAPLSGWSTCWNWKEVGSATGGSSRRDLGWVVNTWPETREDEASTGRRSYTTIQLNVWACIELGGLIPLIMWMFNRRSLRSFGKSEYGAALSWTASVCKWL